MAEARVRLGFRNATDAQIVAMADAVVAGMTNNIAFPQPSVDLATLETALDQFKNAIATQAAGGRAATAHKYQRREALMRLLRKLAHYVEGNCDNDLSVLMSSGFAAKSMNRAQSACPKAVIVRVKNGRATELLVKVSAIANAKCYEIRCAALAEDGTVAKQRIIYELPYHDGKRAYTGKDVRVSGASRRRRHWLWRLERHREP